MMLIIYLNTLDNAPTNWDDPALFTNTSFHGLTISNLNTAITFHKGITFQPLRDISYMVDFSFWGSHVLLGMHLHNIILYLIMVIVCFCFLRQLCRAFDIDYRRSFFFATLSTFIFATHPVHVESVAWLYARKQPLLGLFTFVCLWAYLKAREGRPVYYALSGAAMILAILAQPVAIVIPVIIILLEICIRRQRGEPLPWKAAAVFLLPLGAFAAWQAIRLVLMMQSSGGIMSFHGGSSWTNLLAVSQIFILYIKLIGFTAHYAADYPIRLFSSPMDWQAWLFVILNIILLGSALVAFAKRHFLATFFILWYYLFLLPVSHIFPIPQTITDRYALLPSLSWCVLLGAGLTWLRFLKIEPKGSIISPAFPKLLSWGLAVFIIAGYSALTIRQNDVWQNAQTLWENTVALYPNSFPGNTNLSIIYLDQRRYQDAERLCIHLLKDLPDQNLASVGYLPLTNLASAQVGLGKYAAAIKNYQVILRFDPGMPQANLGLAHCYWQIQDYGNAYRRYQLIAEHINLPSPRVRADCLYRAGFSAWKIGKLADAARLLDQACAVPEKSAGLPQAIAEAYAGMGLKRSCAPAVSPPKINPSASS